MSLSQLETYRKNKELAEQDQFKEVEAVEGSEFVDEPENMSPAQQVQDYTVRKREHNDAEADRVATMLPLMGDPQENVENDLIATDYQKYVNPEVKAPAGVVEQNKDRMAAEIAKTQTATTLRNSPMLRRWLTNPENARIAASDVGILSQLEHGAKAMGRAVKQGAYIGFGQAMNQLASDHMRYAAEQSGKTFLERYDIARGENSGYLLGKPLTPEEIVKFTKPDGTLDQEALLNRGKDPIGALLEAYQGTAVDQFNTLIGNNKQDRQDKARGYMTTAAEYERDAGKIKGSELGQFARDILHNGGKPLGFGEALGAVAGILKERPSSFFAFMGEVSLQSLVMTAPALTIAAATKNPAAGVAAFGANSALIEKGTEPLKYFGKMGFDLTKEGEYERLLANPEVMETAETRANLRALIVGGFDMMSAGLASKVLAKNPAGNMAVQMLVQGLAGGAGEGLAQAGVGDDINWAEVLVEAMAEFSTAPIDVLALGAQKFSARQSKADEAEKMVEGIKELSTTAQQSELRAMDPGLFQKFMEENLNGGDAETIHIPIDEFLKYLDQQQITEQQITELLPSIDPEEIKRARVSGEDITIPTAEYLTRVAGSEMDAFVQEHAKFDPDAMSAAEAKIFRNDEILEQARVAARQEAEAAQKANDDHVLTKMENRLQEELEALGRSKSAAAKEAQIIRSWYKGMSNREGVTPEQLVRRYAGMRPVDGETYKDGSPLTQEAATSSPEFKNWFKASKVVDAEGKPRPVYHSTDADFAAFDPEFSVGGQHWFSDNKEKVEGGEVGASGQGRVVEAYVSIQNPAGWAEYDKYTLDELISKGYDGLALPDDGETTYVAFDPTQIKSINNRGTFDPNDPRFMFQPAPAEGSKALDDFTGGKGVISAEDINETDFSGPGPYTVQAFHGTTHKFDEMQGEGRGSLEGHFGATNYLTSSESDANDNYGADGPDITTRKEQIAERIMGELDEFIDNPVSDEVFETTMQGIADEYDIEVQRLLDFRDTATDVIEVEHLAHHVAHTKLDGGEEQTLELYVRMDKPFVIGGNEKIYEDFAGYVAQREAAETEAAEEFGIDIDEVWDNDEASQYVDDTLAYMDNDLVDVVEKVARMSDDADTAQVFEALERLMYDEGTHQELEKGLRRSEGFMHATDPETGQYMGGHLVAQVIFELGYDAIVMKNADKQFKNMGIEPGTVHIHVPDKHNSNIKSVDNEGTFDRTNPNIYKQDDDWVFEEIPRTDAELLSVKPEALHTLTMLEMKRIVELMDDPDWKKVRDQFMKNVQEHEGKRVFDRVLDDGTPIVITFEKGNGVSKFEITVTSDGEQIAEALAEYSPSSTMGQVTRVMVDDNMQRKGVGTAIYDAIDMHLKVLGGGRVEPSDTNMTDAAKAFWQARRASKIKLDQLPGMRSSTITAIEGLKMQKGPGEQMWNTIKKLPGVKKNELEWMGLEQFLKGQKKITKDEVLEYTQAHRIEMKETTYSGVNVDDLSMENANYADEAEGEAARVAWEERNYDDYEQIVRDNNEGEAWLDDEDQLREAVYEAMEEPSFEVWHDATMDALEKRMEQGGFDGEVEGPAEFGRYTQPGGEEYREIAFSYGGRDENEVYTGAHFGPENTFAHVRVKTRTHKGKRVLHVEEMQSDQDTAGRKRGFNVALTSNERAAIEAELKEVQGRLNDRGEKRHAAQVKFISDYQKLLDAVDARRGDGERLDILEDVNSSSLVRNYVYAARTYIRTDVRSTGVTESFFTPLEDDATKRVAESALRDLDETDKSYEEGARPDRLRRSELEAKLNGLAGVPDFPFKNNTWQDLVTKRVIGMAVDEGYDAVSFNRGYDIASVSAGRNFKVAAGNPVSIQYADDGTYVIGNTHRTDREGLVRMFGEAYADRVDLARKPFAERGEVDLTAPRDVEWAAPGFERAYNKQLPQFLKKYLKQWGAEVRLEPVVNETNGNPYVEITDKMRESIKDNGQLFQGPRGQIQLPTNMDGEAIVKMFKGKDASTFMHESAHYFLGVLDHMARQPGASTEITDMMTTVRAWWRENAEAVAKDGGRGLTAEDVHKYLDEGTTGDIEKDIGFFVGGHEQWARAFETYLMEGKAPSIELQSAFESFRKWLTNIYSKFVHGLAVEVSEDIRTVFDKMLATDEQIALAKEDSDVKMLAGSPEELGVSEEDFNVLKDIFTKSRADATSKAVAAGMAEVKQAQAKENKAKRKEIRAEVEREVNARPEFRAIEWLGNKRWIGEDGEASKLPVGMRLNKQEILDRFGKEKLRKLPKGAYRVYAVDGMGLDEAAGWFGFANADTFINAMLHAGRRDDVVNEITDTRMSEEVRDQLTEKDIETDVKAAYEAAESKGKFIASELRMLNRSIGDMRTAKVLTAKYARQIAKVTLATMRTRDATALNKFLATERKEANAAQEAFKRGDKQAAAGHKYRQLFNHMMYMEGKKIKDEVGKAERLAKRLEKKSTRKNLSPRYLEAIDELLGQYDFRKLGPGQEARRESLNEYIEMMTEAGRENELNIPQHVLDNAARTPYMTLPVHKLRDVYKTLKNIENSARRDKKLIDAKRERDMDEIVNEFDDAFAANLKRKPPSRVEQKGDRTKKGLRQYLNLVLTADTQLREIDGHEDNGSAYVNMKRGIDEATAQLEVRRKEAAKSFEKIYDVYTRKERNQMSVARHNEVLNISLSKWDEIAIVLNMGNADNLQRLTDPKVKGSFSQAQVDHVLDSMTKRDMDFVQSMWNFIDSFYVEIAAREKRVSGTAPTKVEAQAVQTKHGEYKGGYYPLSYDPRLSNIVREETNEDFMANMRRGRFGKAQTRSGHTEERAKSSGRPVKLDIGVAHAHVNNVLHDLMLSEEVTNTWRLLQEPRIKDMFLEYGRQSEHEALELWIQDVATGQQAAQDSISRTARYLKSGFTVSKLAFNISTVLVQVTGLGQSAVVLGKRNLAKGMLAYAKDRGAAIEQIMARSDFMKERSNTFNKDIHDIMGDIKVGPKEGPYKRFMQEVMAPASFYLMTKTQFLAVDVPTWLGAYEQGINDQAMTEAEAIQHADRTVARAQASGIFADRSPIERGTVSPNTRQNDVVRLFTTLGSYMFAKANVAYERTGKTDFTDPKEVISYAFDMTLLFTLEAVLYNLLKGTLPGEDEDEDKKVAWAKFLASETAFSVMGTMPFVRDAVSPLKGFDAGGAYGSVLDTLTKPFTQAAQGEVDKAFVKSLVDSGGMLLHLPSAQTNRAIDAWWRASEGEEVAPMEYLMGKKTK